jgi:hypothetical protein
MSKVNGFISKLFDIVDDILAYILTIIGIVLSAYLPLLKNTSPIDIKLDWWRLGIAAFVALLIVGKQEELDVDETGSKNKSKEGRKKHFIVRMANALSQGVAWNTIIQLASN